MKYLLTRIIILVLAIIAVNYISDYIGEKSHEKFGYLYATVAFFRLLFALAVISLSIFSYEAYKFSKQGKIKERNISLILIALVLLPVLLCVKHFLEFAF